MKTLFLILILSLTVLLAQGSRTEDSLALVAFKEANSGSRLDTLSDSIAWISANPISKWKSVEVDSITGRVTELRINWIQQYGKDLKLPNELVNLTELSLLDLQSTSLNEFPEIVLQLTSLKTLYLAYNNIDSIPPEIEELTALEYLDLRSNELKTLPNEICNFKNLKDLLLYENELTSLPDNIGDLENLEELELQENQLRELPASIGKLSKIRTFNLNYNDLINLPDEIINLNNIFGRTSGIFENHLYHENLSSTVISWLDSTFSNWWKSQTQIVAFSNADSQWTMINTPIELSIEMTDALCAKENRARLEIVERRNYSFSGTTVIPDSGFTGDLDVGMRIIALPDTVLEERQWWSNGETGTSIDTVIWGPDTSHTIYMKIEVRNSNKSPIMSEATMQKIPMNAPFVITPDMTNASDPEGDTLSILTFPGNGYSNSGNTITPDSGYSGSLLVPIMVTDGVGTSKQVSMVIVVDSNITSALPVKFKENRLSTWFADNTLHFNQEVPKDTKLSLFDLSGRQLFSGHVHGRSIRVGSLSKGIYITQIKTQSKTRVQKVAIY